MDAKTTETAGLTVTPIADAPFGVEVRGLDPLRITAAQKTALLQAHDRGLGLLCVPFARHLQVDELHALTALFGESEFAPGLINGYGKQAAPGEDAISTAEQVATLEAKGIDPYLTFLGNVDPVTLKVKPVQEKFFGEWEWHTDMSYIAKPPTYSLLHARQLPATGGDTGFCSQIMAAAALSPELRASIRGRKIKHDSTYGSSGILRPGMEPPASPVEAIGHSHPILRRTPDGSEALFLGRRTNGYVVDMPLSESEALLNALWAHATRPEFQYRHHWRPGQLVVWDNRKLLHMRHPFDHKAARFMWRTQTKGEAVVPA